MSNPNAIELLEIRQELQRKRNESLDENRRKRIEEIFAKRRSQVTKEESSFDQLLEEWQARTYTLKDLPELLKSIYSNEVHKQHFGVIGIRRLGAQADDPPIQEIIDLNTIPRLISFTERYEEPQLQFEAAWALTNLASGTTLQTQSIIDHGGITALVRLLEHENPKIPEQAIWALGNIAGDHTDFRDLILKANVLPPLMRIIHQTHKIDVIKNGTWALSNLVRGNPLPKFELVKETIPTFSKVIQQTEDLETLSDAAWAMSHLSDGRDRISLVLETGICRGLVAHIRMDQRLAALIPSLRVLGNLLSGTEEEMNEVLEVPEVVDKLIEIATNHQNRTAIREACWCLSNIAAGNPQQIQMIFQNSDQIKSIMELSQRPEPEIMKEVLRIFSNATSRASPAQMNVLYECNILDLFCEYLGFDDPEHIKIALDGVSNVLNMGADLARQTNTENLFQGKFDEKGGMELLEALQSHSNTEIYEKALQIIETHYEID